MPRGAFKLRLPLRSRRTFSAVVLSTELPAPAPKSHPSNTSQFSLAFPTLHRVSHTPAQQLGTRGIYTRVAQQICSFRPFKYGTLHPSHLLHASELVEPSQQPSNLPLVAIPHLIAPPLATLPSIASLQ